MKQATNLEKSKRLVVPHSSTRVLEKAERKANYKIVKKDMNSWQPIIKKNREARHLDFTEDHKVAKFNLNASKQKQANKKKNTNLFEETIISALKFNHLDSFKSIEK